MEHMRPEHVPVLLTAGFALLIVGCLFGMTIDSIYPLSDSVGMNHSDFQKSLGILGLVSFLGLGATTPMMIHQENKKRRHG